MAQKTKSIDITITDDKGAFTSFFKRIAGEKSEYDFKGLASLRSLLSNEKARILHAIKSRNPKSIYEISKIVQRDFKSVNDDIRALEKFGFIDLVKEKTGNRQRLKPILVADTIKIELKI